MCLPKVGLDVVQVRASRRMVPRDLASRQIEACSTTCNTASRDMLYRSITNCKTAKSGTANPQESDLVWLIVKGVATLQPS